MLFYNFYLFFVYFYKFDLYNIFRGVDMNRIKQLRDEFKVSQAELGKKLNKTQQQISLYENGINELDLDGYIILSELFNCSIEYIAGKSDIRNPDELKKVPFANAGGLDTNGLDEEDLKELQKQVDYIKRLKGKN